MHLTIQNPVHSELIIKKSRFIGCVQPVASRSQAQDIVAALKQEHPEAAHVCWALMAGGQSAAVDDGEPSGTAGRPMLEVLRHQQLHGVLATVVRYFGGVKLGAGGLVRAYTDSIAQALLGAEKVQVQPMAYLTVQVQYPQEGVVRHVLLQHGVEQLEVTHEARVRLRAQMPERLVPQVRQAVVDATQGQAQWIEDAAHEG
ncbi:YigZ family protein [Lampropedia puyangensis]|uniref:YigZ family protein n=1 Tax=Lampropedia puyangensis TaxID=1330072 RepID=A0A4S8FCL2_9BURK|nr:YigZ family protein [Lampropedia puyangensis]THU05343.1 YigZ family protein [Lampropedia puyangensis]